MDTCKKCGAPADAINYTCNYCGTLIWERIKSSPENNETPSFNNNIELIENNLNALHEIPVPGWGTAALNVIRVYLIIMTFGIVAIFWKKDKKQFNRTDYNKLRAIIVRNIQFLKQASGNADSLLDKIDIVENEFKQIDKKIKQGIIASTIAYILLPVLMILWFRLNRS